MTHLLWEIWHDMQSGAATNDYFDNRLVGWLLFWLIGLIYIFFFILLTKNTLLHILSNVFHLRILED